MLNRIARYLATQSGSVGRTDELLGHLDQLEADGRTISLIDVGSLLVLAIRSPLRAFAKSYALTFAIGVVGWSLASALGAIGTLELALAKGFALEEFEFIERNLVVVFAFALLLAVPSCLAFIKLARRLSRKAL